MLCFSPRIPPWAFADVHAAASMCGVRQGFGGFARVQLRGVDFGTLIHSPLSRAVETAQIVWGSRDGPVTVEPVLREIDLYTFQVRRNYDSYEV